MNDAPCGLLLMPWKPAVCFLPPLRFPFMLLTLLLLLLEFMSSAGTRILPGSGGGGSDDGAGRKDASGRDFDPGEAMPAPPESSAGIVWAKAVVWISLRPAVSAGAGEIAWVRGAGSVLFSDERLAAAACDSVERPLEGCNILVITSVLAKLTAWLKA